MSELFDVFDDEGLTDRDTRTFLVEALVNAEPDDWRDILEPFVPVELERALSVLSAVPNVLQRSQKALVIEEEEEAVAPSRIFLDILVLCAPHRGVTQFSGLHTCARCSRLCRGVEAAACPQVFWMLRTEAACLRWSIPLPAAMPTGWRDAYFANPRPRCDGIYVGECSFKRFIRAGHNIDMRKNAIELDRYGGRGGWEEWTKYRRYVRFLPPDSADGSLWALVLQDACLTECTERVLLAGVGTPRDHVNPVKSEGNLSEGDAATSDAARIGARICAGRYNFLLEEKRIEIHYTAGDGDFQLTFQVSNGGPHVFADSLEWSHYTLLDLKQELTTFNLGKLPDWKGGGLIDEGKDHFPVMRFRPHISLEHLY